MIKETKMEIKTFLTYNESTEASQVKLVDNEKDETQLHIHGGLLKPEYYLACLLQSADASKLDFHQPEELAEKFVDLAIACHEKMMIKLDQKRQETIKRKELQVKDKTHE